MDREDVVRLEDAYLNLVNAVRKHRDSWLNGDEKCYRDNEELYRLLPEGFEVPERDELVELELCKKYIASCHHPNIQYVSPQVRIEELEREVENLKTELQNRPQEIASDLESILQGNKVHWTQHPRLEDVYQTIHQKLDEINLEIMESRSTQPYELGYIHGGNGCCKKVAEDLLQVAEGKRPSDHTSSQELGDAYRRLEDLLAAQNQIIANQREALKGRTERP